MKLGKKEGPGTSLDRCSVRIQLIWVAVLSCLLNYPQWLSVPHELTVLCQSFGSLDGADGQNGKDGLTPKRGIDYWTDADKAEIKGYVDEAILGGAW